MWREMHKAKLNHVIFFISQIVNHDKETWFESEQNIYLDMTVEHLIFFYWKQAIAC